MIAGIVERREDGPTSAWIILARICRAALPVF